MAKDKDQQSTDPQPPEQPPVAPQQQPPVPPLQQQPPGPRKVRVLVDHGAELRCNTVIEVDAATAALLKRDGLVDDDPAAVAACESA